MPIPSVLVVMSWYALSIGPSRAHAHRLDAYARGAGAQAVPAAHVAAPQRAKARDADQQYLRELVDRLEVQRSIVHRMMSAPGGHAAHGSAMDPANWDGLFDVQQREAVALLQHDYREVFTPRTGVASTPSARVAEGRDADERAGMHSLVAAMRQAVTLTEHFLPRLRRASSRDLARRVRTSHAELIKKLGTAARH